MDRVYRVFLCFHIVFSLLSTRLESSNIPVGHLQPLGSHRPAETDLVDETNEWPSPEEFWNRYVKPSRPLILRGAAKYSRAFTEWTDEFLSTKYGDLEVRLEGKKEKSSAIPIGAKGIGRDTIGNFVKNYHNNGSRAYIVSELPSPLYKYVSVIPPLTCGTFKDRLVEVDIWMSGGGTASILHKDAFNAINCLYNGTKQWKMIEYKYEDKIYKAWEPPQMIGGYSKINVNKVDLLKNPLVSEVPWSNLTIYAGDCLFLPKSYYHQVSSFGSHNLAVALLFSRFDHVDDLDFSDCNKTLHPTPLSEMDIDWKYTGHGNLSMGNTDVETVREAIKLFFGDKKTLTREEALEMGKMPLSPVEKEKKLYYVEFIRDNAEWWFDQLQEKGIMALKKVVSLTRDEMRKLTLASEGTDITNTEEYEYGYVGIETIRAILDDLVQKDVQIERSAFIDRYTKDADGTEKFATEFFNKLDSDADGLVSQEELKGNIKVALEPYIKWSSLPIDEQEGYDEKDKDNQVSENENEVGQDTTKHEEL
ncbi:uncharacterized protein LOC116299931 [Actinia tenebrosa]|uniref:Uncharacterized protein LOC116299931 n=1 Tax=Actinia tenebrosa TaxID=6105 RepID=A0A6P8IB86_ACTTE|nr:uncharacterized protein LOC116299931 [Actinia tenebrosa]